MIISSRKNPAVSFYRELNRERKTRERERLFTVEGVKLCTEALRAGLTITSAMVTETAAKKYPDAFGEISAEFEPVIITDDIGAYISDTKTPQGFFFIAEMPRGEKTAPGGRYIILDGLQDSGNIGTIIRTCDALGTDGLILSPDCADIYSPKVVRSTMGSLFRLPFEVTELVPRIEEMKKNGTAVFAAMPDSSAQSIDEVKLPKSCAVIIGNEGSGVSEEVLNCANGNIYIPISGAESLNAAVAAAIFCNEMRRR